MTSSQQGFAESTSTNLLRRVVAGEQEAWRRFVRLYSALIYSRCRARELSAEDSADVVQDVLGRVYRSVGDFRRDEPGQGFRRWLRTITANVIRDHVRLKALEPRGIDIELLADLLHDAESTGAGDSSSPIVPSAETLIVRAAIDRIRVDYEVLTWTAFWRTVVDGAPAFEVAADLKMTPGSVRQARYKILRRLRAELVTGT